MGLQYTPHLILLFTAAGLALAWRIFGFRLHKIVPGAHDAEEVLRKAHNELERQVKEQTAELTKANEKLKCEIEDRKRAEEALKDSLTLIGRAKREWESTADSLPHLICLLDSRGFVQRTNRTVEQWQLDRVTQVKGKRFHDLFHPGCNESNCYLEAFWSLASEKLAAGETVESEVEDPVLKRTLQIQLRPISASFRHPGEETTHYSVMVLEDISGRKRAEIEMAALQEQFRQSQKMEAIGRLAGGIAHDFNNMLTPIVGYSQLAMSTLAPQDPLREDIAEIQKGAERAANLVRNILTFSRRQSLNPQVINLNTVLIDVDKMLRRLIGEHIELVTLPDPGPGCVKIDPSQFEQVLMNLVVNARDAMPQGGKLILETSGVSLPQPSGQAPSTLPAGRYVMVSVSDTGCGMSPEVKERIFEPFFTTKANGGGTGLGLSTVYGIIKENRGHIFVYSEPGQGSTFKIYFPQAEEETAKLPRQHDVISSSQGNETILLVEDDPAVRGFAARVLSDRGYHVVEATHGLDALRVVQEKADRMFHLLLTDVVMPQMGGKELADRLTDRWNHLKVLFVSGYTDHTALCRGSSASKAPLLEKPFSASALAAKVREVLDCR